MGWSSIKGIERGEGGNEDGLDARSNTLRMFPVGARLSMNRVVSGSLPSHGGHTRSPLIETSGTERLGRGSDRIRMEPLAMRARVEAPLREVVFYSPSTY